MAGAGEEGRNVAATVAFTDLVGSTELSARLSAAGADELRRTHFELLRTAIDAHNGAEVKNLGDGVMAVFPSVGAALDASVAIQHGAHLHTRQHADVPLQIRVGIATGDCVEEGGDYFGEPVVQAARLCGAADGGDILVAEVVRLSAPRGHHRFDRLGAIELKGIPEPVDVARLQWTPPEAVKGSPVPLPDRLSIPHHVPYVGRQAERDQLSEAVKAAAGGARQLLLLSGEAGLGKTRLATEVARAAHDDGALVLYGRCDDQLPLPYGPWVQALRHWSRHTDDAVGRTGRADLALLLPELASRPLDGDGPVMSDQHSLYTSLTSLLVDLSEERPVLVVLDDLHWADRDSLLLLRHVVGNVLSGRVMLLGTFRDTDLTEDHPLEELLAALRRETGVTRIALEGLGEAEIRSMLQLSTPDTDASDELIGLLAEETGGNPFFLGELLWHLSESGRPLGHLVAPAADADDSVALSLPESVREVVRARVRALGGTATTTLTHAAVIGREFDLGLLTEVVELDRDQVIDAVDEAVLAGILDEVGGDGHRLAFSHALVRRVLTETLSKRRRSLVHRSVAEALERRGSSPHASASPAELAVHWEAAQVPDGERRLVELLIAAGQDARQRGAPEEAIAWFDRAAGMIPDRTTQACEVAVLLGEAERQAGRPDHRERLLAAAHDARSLGRADLVVASALVNHRGFQSGAGMVDDDRIEVLRWALELVSPSSTDRARLLVQLAMELPTSDRSRLDLALEAVEVARGTGDANTLVDVISLALTILVAPVHFGRAVELSSEAMAATDAAVDPLRRMQVLFVEQAVQLIRGDVDAAARCATEYEALVERLGQPVRRWTVALRGAVYATLVDDVAVAQNRIDASLELGLATGQPDAFVSYGALVMGLAIHQGRTEPLIPLIVDAAEQNPGLPILRAGAASFLADAGRLEEAAAFVSALGDPRRTLPHDHFLLATAGLLADAVERLEDHRIAQALHELIAPHAELVAVHPAGCVGSVSFSLGRLGKLLGREDARSMLEDSLERHQRLRSPYYQARSHLALGAWDPSQLDLAGALAERHGFSGIQRELARLGGATAESDPGSRP